MRKLAIFLNLMLYVSNNKEKINPQYGTEFWFIEKKTQCPYRFDIKALMEHLSWIKKPLRLWIYFFLVTIVCACSEPKEQISSPVQRSNYKTQLIQNGPSPQEWKRERPPENVESIYYESGDLILKAWYAKPMEEIAQKPYPAVVYLHGGFAFDSDDFENARPFLENGFALLTPTFRGENGNPGNFEMMYGEVEDAIAAIHWLGQQPEIDNKRIFVFGHSVGGGISALISMYDVPFVKLTGSSGGLYSESVFIEWRDFTPFNYQNETERRLRVLLGNTQSMKISHIAYIGKEDKLSDFVDEAKSEAIRTSAPLEILLTEGDHFSSLTLARDTFIKRIKNP